MTPDAETIVRLARGWIDTPYRHRSSLKGAGCDCLGLLRGIWRELYDLEPEPVPPYAANGRDGAGADALLRAANTHLLPSDKAPDAGDVVLFRLRRTMPPRHCGVMLDTTAFVHAQEQIGVVAAPLSAAWRRRIAGVYRFPQQDKK